MAGDANLAISELLRAHETIETFLDDIEASQATELAAQKDRAERGFREGRFTPKLNAKTRCDRSLCRWTPGSFPGLARGSQAKSWSANRSAGFSAETANGEAPSVSEGAPALTLRP